MVQISGKNSKPFWSMLSGRLTKITPPSPLRPKDEGLRGIKPMVCQWCYGFISDSLWQIIIKCHRFYYKIRQLLQIATILLQNATVITKSDVRYELRQQLEKVVSLGRNSLKPLVTPALILNSIYQLCIRC